MPTTEQSNPVAVTASDALADPAQRPAPQRRSPARTRRTMWTAVRAVVGWVLALLTFFPIAWLVISAFKPAGETFSAGLPSHWTLANITYVLTKVPFPRYLLNSALVSVVVTLVALVLHSMAAYALARLKFTGRTFIFSLMVSTLLVSLPVILVPLFIIVKQLGLLNSYAGLIVPMIFNVFGIFLLRQYYLNFPSELEDAATLDGCGYFGLFWRIVFPMSRAPLASLAVLFFLANWNSFLWPLTITSNQKLDVIQVGIAGLQGQYSNAYNYVLAASLIAVIPTIVVFLVGQRWLVDSLKSSGLK